jgi:hypothetical protein
MRRLLVAGIALACMASLALAQSSAGGGGGGGGSSGGSVSVSNFPSTQPVSGTVAATQSGTWNTGLTGTLPAFAQTPTFNVGTIAGIATDASVQQVRTALGSPFQSGGSIGNTAFGISGSLPAFAATPTFNLGTLNGAATDASVVAVKTALGSPLQAGGSVSVSNLPATQAVSASALPLPAGAATSANQSSEIAALGAVGDTAYAGSGSASIVAALKGLYGLTAATPRVTTFADVSQASVAASANASGALHDPGFNGPYTRYNATFYSTQAGTVQIIGTDDNVNFYNMTSQAYTAASVVTYSVPITFRYYLPRLVNGATAATGVTIKSSFTAN